MLQGRAEQCGLIGNTSRPFLPAARGATKRTVRLKKVNFDDTHRFFVRLRALACSVLLVRRGPCCLCAIKTMAESTGRSDYKEEKEKEKDVRSSNIVAAKGN